MWKYQRVENPTAQSLRFISLNIPNLLLYNLVDEQHLEKHVLLIQPRLNFTFDFERERSRGMVGLHCSNLAFYKKQNHIYTSEKATDKYWFFIDRRFSNIDSINITYLPQNYGPPRAHASVSGEVMADFLAEDSGGCKIPRMELPTPNRC